MYSYCIAFFNMEKDLMWTVKKSDDCVEIWEPRKIGNVEKSKVIENIPMWLVHGSGTTINQPMYFDGNIRVHKLDDFEMYSYDYKGNHGENWIKGQARDSNRIRICGQYIFVISDEIGWNRDVQFRLEFQPGNALRVNWMEGDGFNNATSKAAIDIYENSKTKAII